MLSSKIKIGDKVAVYVEWLEPHTEHKLSTGKVVEAEHGQISPHRGIRQDGSFRRHLAEATVVAKGATWYKAESGWSSYSRKQEDGILVEFAEPLTVMRSQKEHVVKTAVVTAKFVIDKWEDVVASRKAAAEQKVIQEQRLHDAAASFGPRLEDFRASLSAIGIETGLHADVSGIYGEGREFSLSLNSAIVDGKRQPTSWGSSSVNVDRRVFEALVAIAVKHGEVVK